ncbi:MAG: hypothetical protein ACRCZI_10385 [Cetobacterium sp.]
MADLYVVTQDGRPIKHGLTRRQAEEHAAYLANGFERKRANEKRRVAEFEIKPDYSLLKQRDENWKNRNH